jgi:hypothetical protein
VADAIGTAVTAVARARAAKIVFFIKFLHATLIEW